MALYDICPREFRGAIFWNESEHPGKIWHDLRPLKGNLAGGRKPIVVGRRLTGTGELCERVVDRCTCSLWDGRVIFQAGIVPTPTVSMAFSGIMRPGGILVISASHNAGAVGTL